MQPANKKTVLTIFIALIALMLIMAKTDIMMPLMHFILNVNQASPVEIALCIAFSGLGLYLFYSLLVTVAGYYLNKIETREQQKQGGEVKR